MEGKLPVLTGLGAAPLPVAPYSMLAKNNLINVGI